MRLFRALVSRAVLLAALSALFASAPLATLRHARTDTPADRELF